MRVLYLALENALAVVRAQDVQCTTWVAEVHLVGKRLQSVACDPLRSSLVYCGTFGQGLWRSDDAGQSWNAIGTGVVPEQVMSVATSPLERVDGHSVVYAGCEPSALYRSEDSGTTWRELKKLRELPSAPEWSFPPRPYTSHVRWITPDPVHAGHLFVAIEAGALVRSFDGGETWEDRRPDGPLDTHTLSMPRMAPNRLYSAAGDGFIHPGNGFVQSNDGGDTWQRFAEGLHHHYLWSVAVDPADPERLVISAARGPQQAHQPQSAESALYRRVHGQAWQQCHEGLPAEQGMLASVVTVNGQEPDVFYAANNKGVYRSPDVGAHWEELSIQWPQGFALSRAQSLIVFDE